MRRRSVWLASLLMVACGDDVSIVGGSGNGGEATGAGSATGGAPPQGAAAPLGGGGGAATSMGGNEPLAGAGGADPWAGPIESLAVLDLGEHDTGSTQYFELPNNMLGLTAVSETADTGAIGISSLRPPTGGSVIYNFEIPGTGFQVFGDQFTVSGANPQSDLTQSWPVQEGTWQYRISADLTPKTVRSRIYVRRTNDGAFHGGAVDFHVYLAPGGADQGYVTGVLNTMFADYYTPLVGLTLGNVSFQNIGSQYSNIDSGEEFRSMLATSSTAASAPAVNLFVVGDFDGEISNALGIAGGIPGTPVVHGTRRSGVAYAPTFNSGYDASVLAHEIGHLSGLFHTSEYQTETPIFDPLGDTAECTNIQNINPDSCPDVTNVMFPIAYGGSQLSALQLRVLQGSALYRGILQEGGAPSGPLVSPPPPSPGSSSFVPTPAGELRGRSALESALEAYWCASGGDAEALVWEAFGDRATLLAIVGDDAAFDVARARALSMLSRFALTDDEGAEVHSLARAVLVAHGAARQLQLTAIDVMEREGASDIGSFAPRLRDPLVASRAARNR